MGRRLRGGRKGSVGGEQSDRGQGERKGEGRFGKAPSQNSSFEEVGKAREGER